MTYTYANNDKAFKGDDGPLIGLLAWPDTNNAANWLSPAGTRAASRGSRRRRKSTTRTSRQQEQDQRKDEPHHRQRRARAPSVLLGSPQDQHRDRCVHEPTPDASPSGKRDGGSSKASSTSTTTSPAISMRRRYSASTSVKSSSGLSLSGLVGNAVLDQQSKVDGAEGVNFLDPNFVSINNTLTKSDRTIITQRRLVSAFGQATASSRTTCT